MGIVFILKKPGDNTLLLRKCIFIKVRRGVLKHIQLRTLVYNSVKVVPSVPWIRFDKMVGLNILHLAIMCAFRDGSTESLFEKPAFEIIQVWLKIGYELECTQL